MDGIRALDKTLYLRESGTGGGKAASPRAGAGFVKRHSGETKHEGPGCKLLCVFASPSAVLGEKAVPNMCLVNELMETDRSQLWDLQLRAP